MTLPDGRARRPDAELEDLLAEVGCEFRGSLCQDQGGREAVNDCFAETVLKSAFGRLYDFFCHGMGLISTKHRPDDQPPRRL